MCIATFLYLAIIFLAFFWHDAINAFFFDGKIWHRRRQPGAAGQRDFAFVLHPLLPFVAASRRRQAGLLLLRHLRRRARTRPGKVAQFLNERHMLFAWASLISVGFADFYIRLVASGAILDVRIL